MVTLTLKNDAGTAIVDEAAVHTMHVSEVGAGQVGIAVILDSKDAQELVARMKAFAGTQAVEPEVPKVEPS